jgi:prepilin signal peptidase PulO-like enzyme (type II secretory pathway)
LYAALLLGLPFFLTVLITKEKALGSGDIRIALISGFLIGRTNIMVWLYITIFSALIYGLILGYKKKSIKNLKIPFAPFMILGTVLSLLLDMYI